MNVKSGGSSAINYADVGKDTNTARDFSNGLIRTKDSLDPHISSFLGPKGCVRCFKHFPCNLRLSLSGRGIVLSSFGCINGGVGLFCDLAKSFVSYAGIINSGSEGSSRGEKEQYLYCKIKAKWPATAAFLRSLGRWVSSAALSYCAFGI